MLSGKDRQEVESKLKMLSSDIQLAEAIKSKIREKSRTIQQILDRVKTSEDSNEVKLALLSKLSNETLFNSVLDLHAKSTGYSELNEKFKTDREKLIREKIKAIEDKERISKAIENVKQTIADIQKTVKDTQVEEEAKRNKIEADLEKSLDDIRDKIKTHEKESVEIEKQTVELKTKVQQARDKLLAIQADAEKKSSEKEEEVKGEKQGLLDRLKDLEKETEEIQKISQEYTQVEKKNFDNKLSIHIKQTRFQEYVGSFENTASVINRCKEDMFRAVAKLNEAKAKKDNDAKTAEQLDKSFLSILGTNDKLKDEIEATKKAKQQVRSKILDLQGQIKTKKEQAAQ